MLVAVQPAMSAHRLEDIEAFEAISQDADTRRIILQMPALSRNGCLPSFLEQVAHDRDLDEKTKGQVIELASDRAFLLAAEEYLRRTQRAH